jgi:hypothetical protein
MRVNVTGEREEGVQLASAVGDRSHADRRARGRVYEHALLEGVGDELGPRHAHQRDVDRDRVLGACHLMPHARRDVEHVAGRKVHLVAGYDGR